MIHNRVPFLAFLTFAQLWAYWHVVRQHYGFITLYQRKNGEPAGRANRVDTWSFYALMLAPFGSFLIRHPDARLQLGMPLQPIPVEQALLVLLHLCTVAAVLIYAANELHRVRRGHPWNLPKNLFLASCVPLHLLIFLHPWLSTHIDIRLFAVFVTVQHNVQYHGLVWFYSRTRYGEVPDVKRFGWSGRISRTFLTYYGAALLYTIIYRYPNWRLTAIPFAPATAAQPGLFSLGDLAITLWWGFAFHHYYLDQHIWRPSRDQQLARTLGLPGGEDAAARLPRPGGSLGLST